jgi:hypothetical protein
MLVIFAYIFFLRFLGEPTIMRKGNGHILHSYAMLCIGLFSFFLNLFFKLTTFFAVLIDNCVFY